MLISNVKNAYFQVRTIVNFSELHSESVVLLSAVWTMKRISQSIFVWFENVQKSFLACSEKTAWMQNFSIYCTVKKYKKWDKCHHLCSSPHNGNYTSAPNRESEETGKTLKPLKHLFKIVLLLNLDFAMIIQARRMRIEVSNRQITVRQKNKQNKKRRISLEQNRISWKSLKEFKLSASSAPLCLQ